MNPTETLAQIGRMNVFAISGGRVWIDADNDDLLLPVSHGYRVRICLEADDTYTVTREMKRGNKIFTKGVERDVYCDQIGEVAYRASCYKNVEFGDDAR